MSSSAWRRPWPRAPGRCRSPGELPEAFARAVPRRDDPPARAGGAQHPPRRAGGARAGAPRPRRPARPARAGRRRPRRRGRPAARRPGARDRRGRRRGPDGRGRGGRRAGRAARRADPGRADAGHRHPADRPPALARAPAALRRDIGPALAPFDVVLAVGMPVFRLFGHSEGPALSAGHGPCTWRSTRHESARCHAPAVGLAGDVAAGLDGLLGRLGAPTAASAARQAGRGAPPPRPGAARARVARGPRPAPACRPPRSRRRPGRRDRPRRPRRRRDPHLGPQPARGRRGRAARAPGSPTAAAPSGGGCPPRSAPPWPTPGGV